MNEQISHNVGPSRIDMTYERLGDTSSPPVFMIMGGGAQMIAWPEGFCEELVSQGLQVIRFDNLDTGLSTHSNDSPEPDLTAALGGDFTSVAYTLSDMAADTVGLMQALGFDSVHLVGASMGGMIAQTIAIEYPGYPFDEIAAVERAGRAWDRDHDPLGMLRQSVAVLKSGDRTENLRSLHIPALVIHGKADRMCNVSGGIATADAIPGAELVVFEGMGHGFPQPLWPNFATLIAELVHRVESTAP
jgi:pimeloyl-ACP methyl ester carboxylesterase